MSDPQPVLEEQRQGSLQEERQDDNGRQRLEQPLHIDVKKIGALTRASAGKIGDMNKRFTGVRVTSASSVI